MANVTTRRIRSNIDCSPKFVIVPHASVYLLGLLIIWSVGMEVKYHSSFITRIHREVDCALALYLYTAVNVYNISMLLYFMTLRTMKYRTIRKLDMFLAALIMTIIYIAYSFFIEGPAKILAVTFETMLGLVSSILMILVDFKLSVSDELRTYN